MAKAQTTKEFQAFVDYLLGHAERFAAFRRPPQALEEKEVPGHYHFDIQGLGYEQIQEKFKREECFKQGLSELEKNGVLPFSNYVKQNDMLSSAEKTYLDMTRTRIRQSVYAMNIKKGHSYADGLARKLVDNVTSTAGTKPGDTA